MTLCFQCRGHGFDPWLGKFHMPCDTAIKKKKKKIQWTLELFSELCFCCKSRIAHFYFSSLAFL